MSYKCFLPSVGCLLTVAFFNPVFVVTFLPSTLHPQHIGLVASTVDTHPERQPEPMFAGTALLMGTEAGLEEARAGQLGPGG